ncbi:chemotaxis response regulator CheB [Agrobacterium larrymoorei]|uniref:Chemotaxis response regulator CheB n=2 Tax=Agrobacterium TaxID=357 RepID=A0ABU0UMC9_9HYPH|nr:chemotaxis response regulator CheB [Agrobacterium larrymoorei]
MNQRSEAQDVPVVGIGSSAGGLEALREMFASA